MLCVYFHFRLASDRTATGFLLRNISPFKISSIFSCILHLLRETSTLDGFSMLHMECSLGSRGPSSANELQVPTLTSLFPFPLPIMPSCLARQQITLKVRREYEKHRLVSVHYCKRLDNVSNRPWGPHINSSGLSARGSAKTSSTS